MIEPCLSDDELLTDIRACRSNSEDFHLWWLGQSGFLLAWQNSYLLFDPYLSDSLTRKYANTDKPHVRMTRRVIDPRRLAMVNVVTSSHNHTDHLDAETLLALFEANPALDLVVPAANRDFAAKRLDLAPDRLVAIDAGESLQLPPFKLYALPAAHEALEQDALGRHRYLGYIVEFGPWKVYHSGDTIRYPGQAELLREHGVDVALLPINGRLPERRVSGNLWGHEAAELARAAQVRLVIPCHYELFNFNTVTPEDFTKSCAKLSQPYCVLRNGEHWDSSRLSRR